MSIEACADLVRRGDPDRFLSAMTARPDDRPALFALYALNLEVARAPWVTAEAMIAEMRLQWWKDAIEEAYSDAEPRRHEVVTPLADIIRTKSLPRAPFDALIAARSWDIYKDPHANDAALWTYLNDTNGALTHLAFHALGGRGDAQGFGAATGVARLFVAIPALQNAQKYPLVDGSFEGVRQLASTALDRLDLASKKLRGSPRAARAALRSEWMAKDILSQAISEPSRVIDGDLVRAEGAKKLRLMMKTALGRF